MLYMPLTSIIVKKGLFLLRLQISLTQHSFRGTKLTRCCSIRHLNGTVLLSFARPAVLITDAYNALNNQPSRRQRDQEFLGNYLSFVNVNIGLENVFDFHLFWLQGHRETQFI